MKKLTIGLCVYDDFDGIYFTIQSLRLHHSEVMSEVEFIIINNNPKSHLGNEIQKYTRHITEPLTYVEYSSYSSTALRDKIFTLIFLFLISTSIAQEMVFNSQPKLMQVSNPSFLD